MRSRRPATPTLRPWRTTPAHRLRAALVFAASVTVAGAGCSSTSDFGPDTRLRPATDVPARFEPQAPERRLAPADTLAGSGCLNPLVDPRSGATLRMVRSGSVRGDYEVPDGRYGLAPDELLRLECNTGIPVGIAPR